ncbi:putative integral membrane protein conserved region-domain-containing protein [Mucor lusitanicus]|uniref:SMP-LTD domain-containing protein n=2 Tax=Mucor circinelloides f. lusitanicus TaxID=29924 RepID=A0A162U296_MUCCL|nr:putative integral membrane protein conserved region-domain-containing protein [Mucor lusitanicus]OAD08912.1 hypothetical protein MUCCIDRAFT_105875 [Mucor lusitanicus CBS 277.49]
MVPPFIEIIAIYLFGGVTFIPITFLLIYFVLPTTRTATQQDQAPTTHHNSPTITTNAYAQNGKKGWIRLTKTYKPKESESNVAVLLSYVQGVGVKRQKEHVYAELKCGALFIYETNQTEDECKIIIPVHNYNVAMYNPDKQQQQDHDMFSKSTWLKLTPKADVIDMNSSQVLIPHHDDGSSSSPYLTTHNELFITCARPVDKEDWYFGLLAATQMMADSSSHVEMMDMTHFDPSAMQTLISTVQQDAAYREVQWLNAILGRLFLGLYKTDEMRRYLQDKISKKAKKIKRPGFLGDIVVQSVDIGDSIPYVTQPKLLSLTPEGDLEAEATIHYAGGLRVVIQTDFTWTYSSLMKPIRVPLVLSVMLKKMSGKFLVKVKPPPTNRCWIGFYEMPDMEWEIQPIVSDKQIRLSMVTNAIQSKIREFIVENIVLPNMDDFPFCPSGGHGGIFGERVPKPSSPKSAIPSTPSNRNMDVDMLGNKLNKTVVPPKVVVTQQMEQDSILTVPTLTKTPARRATVGNLDVSNSLKAENVHSTSRARGYSNPNIRPMSSSSSSSSSNHSEESMPEEAPSLMLVSSPIIASAMTTGRRMASNMGFRKRQPTASTATIVAPSLASVPSEEEEQAEHSPSHVDVSATAIVESVKEESILDTDAVSVASSSASSAAKSGTNLLSKFSSVSKAAKLNINTNKKLYTMAGNLFNKKKVSQEMRDERNRELLESHNRKMMNLFLNNEPAIIAAKQQQPPPLPPRPAVINKTCSSPSFSSSSSEDEAATTTPTSIEYIPKQEDTITTTSILIHEYQSSVQ